MLPTLLASLAALALLTLLVATGATRAIDVATIQAFQRLASTPLDVVVNLHTVIGQAIPTVAIAVIAAAILWWRGRRRAAFAPLVLLVTGPVELALKYALQHSGPPDEYIRAITYLGTGLHTPSSFPSGHVTRITFLCALAAFSTPNLVVRTLAVTFVAFTVFARVYIGDHWVSDALAGVALGLACAAAARLLAGQQPQRMADGFVSGRSPRRS